MSEKPEWMRLHDELRASDSYARLLRLKRLGYSINVFNGNAEELFELLSHNNGNEMLSQLLPREARVERMGFMLIVARKLHNFVAAAGTLIDHTRRFVTAVGKNTDFETEHAAAIRASFGDHGVSQFIRKLRNYVVHRDLPLITQQFHWTNASKKIRMATALSRDSLLEWKDWGSVANAWLQAQPTHIDLDRVAREYTTNVRSFHETFAKRATAFLATDLEFLKRGDEAIALARGTDVRPRPQPERSEP